MLHVASPKQAEELLLKEFGHLSVKAESVPLNLALDRILWEDFRAPEDVPGFDRSTVDGYALRAADSFGCSESLPSLLTLTGEVFMGKPTELNCASGCCIAIPTGGQLPDGADAVVMLEYTEDYGDGTIGVTKPVAPGMHILYAKDDAAKGQVVLRKGKRITVADVGALAALGQETLLVARPPVVGILSTGDELVPVGEKPEMGQVRDVNAMMLAACVAKAGAVSNLYGICPDDPEKLADTVVRMAEQCDVVLLSGGSSAGTRDAVQDVVERLGRPLLHGIAIKPGKPTIVGEVAGKPLIGLPGHPVAALFVCTLFVCPMLERMMGRNMPLPRPGYHAVLTSAIPSNHGREEYVAVILTAAPEGLLARPIMGKSGLITQLSGADGYLRIPRDCEGLAEGQEVEIVAL